MSSCPWKKLRSKKISINVAVDANTRRNKEQWRFDPVTNAGPAHDLFRVLLARDNAILEREGPFRPVSIVLGVMRLLDVVPDFIREENQTVPPTTKPLQKSEKNQIPNPKSNKKHTEGILSTAFESSHRPSFELLPLSLTSTRGPCEERC
jgi:hypothetical protein